MPVIPKRKIGLGKSEERGQRAGTLVDWKPAYLAALSEIGVGTRACKAAKIAPVTVWRARRDDPEFAKAYNEALKIGAELLMAEAVRRARDGVRRMKFNTRTGEPFIDPETSQPYIEHEYSDTLMCALLKYHFPEFKEKSETHVSTTVNNFSISVEQQKALQERKRLALPVLTNVET